MNQKSRVSALRTLGKTDDFENLPYLIYALTDPDIEVARIAETGLRQISRRLDGVGISFEDLVRQRNAAVQAWKQWYKSVNPDAIFIE